MAKCGGGSAGAKGRGGVWEVGVEIGEFGKRYRTSLNALGVSVPEGRKQREAVPCAGPVQGE